ncbi:MAG: hypothetical protein PHD51_01730 [Patescibacteria group bacterium]|nr:hypothetical protein [Patescibacteria group bacterium]MDD5490417.1 hypothetical protein [Patescibacteria group bacterium]
MATDTKEKGKVHLDYNLSQPPSPEELDYGRKVFESEEGEPLPPSPKFRKLKEEAEKRKQR